MGEMSLETGEVDLGLTLAPLAMLPGDPTVRLAPGRFVRSTLTPEGPGTSTVSRLSPEALADRARVERALGAVRGIGPWTLSCLATATWGDADTVSSPGIPASRPWSRGCSPASRAATMPACSRCSIRTGRTATA